MQLKIQNQLLMNAGTIVSEVNSDKKGYRCWIAISAVPVSHLNNVPNGVLHIKNLNRLLIPQNEKQIYTVRKVCVDAEYIKNNWDLGKNQVIFDFFDVCYSFEEVLDFLKERGIDSDSFSEPWNTDYPL
jgi:hypothetical protein